MLKSFTVRLSVYRNHLLSGVNAISTGNRLIVNRSYGYSSFTSKHNIGTHSTVIGCKCQVYRCYSRGLLDGDILNLQNTQKERELSTLSSLFPNPRVTLNELAAKSPDSVFDIQYKQSVVTPKGGKKKTEQNNWICSYNFVWPQKMKFEGVAISKRQAAEKAATQALHWLYANKRIDDKGRPIFDKAVIDELNNSLQEPLKASISETSMERIERVWQDYENEIKSIYDTTFEAAKHKVVNIVPSVMIKDSTIDDDDELPIDGAESTSNEASDLSETKFPVHPVYGRQIIPPTRTALDRRKRQLNRAFEYYDERTPLPIDEYRLVTSVFFFVIHIPENITFIFVYSLGV